MTTFTTQDREDAERKPMNANELADKLEMGCHDWADDAATMLRQQQAEIEALKKEAALQRLSDFTQEADNEPVAWWDGKEPSVLGLSYFKNDYCPIPLYTHPAKTLTDEEILEVGNSVTNLIDSNEGWIEFAKAILRKAQEK